SGCGTSACGSIPTGVVRRPEAHALCRSILQILGAIDLGSLTDYGTSDPAPATCPRPGSWRKAIARWRAAAGSSGTVRLADAPRFTVPTFRKLRRTAM